MDINLEKIRELFKGDRFATDAGVFIESVDTDEVVCSLRLDERHMNMAGVVQGGAIFTLADLAFAVHSNLAFVCGEGEGITLGQSCNISYLKSPKGEILTARSKCISSGRSMSVYQISVSDNLGNAVAAMTGNGFHIRK
ncbi:MAG: PaaI family thioesterase [Clostridiales Family XIII bacterium]|nr:PaaI family thioesterase [Clostridiales Family XIII bacterium]